MKSGGELMPETRKFYENIISICDQELDLLHNEITQLQERRIILIQRISDAQNHLEQGDFEEE
jgi:hypothetical protein